MTGVVFESVNLDHAQMLFDWRKSDHVAANMATIFDTDFEGHLAWLGERSKDPYYGHWVIYIGGHATGLVNFQRDHRDSGQGTWGYYIGEQAYMGFGALIPPYLYNALFLDLGFKVLYAEVLAHNEAARSMNITHGYVRENSKDHSIERGGEELLLEHYILTRKVWQQQSRYHRFRASFTGLETILNV